MISFVKDIKTINGPGHMFKKSVKKDHLYFMDIALKEAEKGARKGEIPIGAVIERDGEIISRAHNLNRKKNNPTLHAEMIAIKRAASKLKNERLVNCNLYVTKEPCAMCSGAIIHSRIKTVFIGARDIKYGCCGTVFNICGNDKFNHIPEIVFNINEKECADILQKFFKKLRESKK